MVLKSPKNNNKRGKHIHKDRGNKRHVRRIKKHHQNKKPSPTNELPLISTVCNAEPISKEVDPKLSINTQTSAENTNEIHPIHITCNEDHHDADIEDNNNNNDNENISESLLSNQLSDIIQKCDSLSESVIVHEQHIDEMAQDRAKAEVYIKTLQTQIKKEKKSKKKYAHHLKLNIQKDIETQKGVDTLSKMYSQSIQTMSELSSKITQLIQQTTLINGINNNDIDDEESKIKDPATTNTIKVLNKLRELNEVLDTERLKNMTQVIRIMESEFGVNVDKMKQDFHKEYKELVDRTNNVIEQMKINFDKRIKKRTENLVNSFQEKMDNTEWYWRRLLKSSLDDKDNHHISVMSEFLNNLVRIKTSYKEEIGQLQKESNKNLEIQKQSYDTKIETMKQEICVITAQNEALKQQFETERGTLKQILEEKTNETENALESQRSEFMKELNDLKTDISAIKQRNQKLKKELDIKSMELSTANESIIDYENSIKDIRNELNEMRENEEMMVKIKNDEINELKFKMNDIASNVKAQQSIEYETKLSKMDMELNLAINQVEHVSNVMNEQQQKNQEMINKLKTQIVGYKSRNKGLKSKLEWLETSMKDLSKLYPRTHSKITLKTSSSGKTITKKQDNFIDCLDNSTLITEVDKLRETLKSKDLELCKQKTNNVALNEKLRLTQDLANNYKQELDDFIEKTNDYVREKLL